MAPSYTVVHGWPTLPEGLPALGNVAGVSVDSHNHVFVFHRGARPLLCFDPETGKVLRSWGDGMFVQAHGLAVDSDDNVWATDGKSHQVFKFSHDGQLLLTVGVKNTPGVDHEHFNRPTGIRVAPDGNFYVTDGYVNNRVVKFSPAGKFISEWGVKGSAPGEFNTPHAIAIDAEGRVYVADRGNGRIQVFDKDGKFLHQWSGKDLGRPWGLDVGTDGYLYVADGGDLNPQPVPGERDHIVKMDLQGRIVDKWGSFGYYDGQFNWLHVVGIGKKGEVYAGDILGQRIQKFVPSRER